MPEPEGVVNCCCDADLGMWAEQSIGELAVWGSPNCWHETDLGIPLARWSRHRKEPGWSVGEQMHCPFAFAGTLAAVAAILEAIFRAPGLSRVPAELGRSNLSAVVDTTRLF